MKFFYTVVNRGLIVKYWELGLPFYILHGAEKSYTKWDIITLFTGGFTIITKHSILDVAAALDPTMLFKKYKIGFCSWKILKVCEKN